MTEINEDFSKAANLIKYWLEKRIKLKFRIDIELGDDIVIHDLENSGAMKIIKTYTEQITESPDLKTFLDDLINSVMSGKITLSQMVIKKE
jgi:hypothetical protein